MVAQQAKKTLTQAEIDALLSAAPGEGTGAAGRVVRQKNIKPYDFRRPDKFSKEHIRTLQVLHQSFARLVGQGLASRLRSLVAVRLSSVEQVLYEEYLQLIPNQTVIHVLSMEPFPGSVLLEYSQKMALTVVDRLLGGTGRTFEEPHEITDIESAIINKFAAFFMEIIRDAWSNVAEVQPQLRDTTLSAQFAQVAAPSDVVIMVLFEFQVGEQVGAMSICLPHQVLEPVLPRLTTQGWFVSGAHVGDDRARNELKRHVGRVAVPVSAVLGTTQITAAELVSLQPGDVVRLDNLASRDIEVRIGDRCKFRATPGLTGNRVAVRVTAVIEPLEGLHLG